MSDWTQSDLDAVNKAIANGAVRVRYSNPQREVEYRSIDDLIKIRNMIREDLGQTENDSRVSYADYSKGT